MDPYSNQSYNSYAYGQQPSYDVNSYYKAYQTPASSFPLPGAASTSSQPAPVPANAYEYDVGIVAQQSVYVPGAAIDKRGGAGGKLAKGGKRLTVLRKGGGKVWEDQTLLEWNPCTSLFSMNKKLRQLINTLQHGSVCSLAILATMSPMTCWPTHSTSILLSRKPV